LATELGEPVDYVVEVFFGVFFLEDLILHHELGKDFDEFELFGVKWLQWIVLFSGVGGRYPSFTLAATVPC
jgi:hypothetical protein